MTKEQYEQAADILDSIRMYEKKINQINHTINMRQEHGICRQYWSEICDILYNDDCAKVVFDKDIFVAITGYLRKMKNEKEKLEKRFEEL